MAAGPTTIPTYPASLTRAVRRLWTVLFFVIIGIGIGGAWDRAYHATHAFDTFYSPPHLFIYANYLVASALVLSIVFSREIRPWFGPGFGMRPLPFEIPGSLFILGGGIATIAIAGVLDDAWHSTFGLDETGWSTPHAMLGWGLLVVALGIIACRLALHRHRPMARYTPFVLAYVFIAFSAVPFMGPIYNNNAPETVQATSLIPVLLAQPAAQHTFRIYLAWNLDRTNPLFPILGGFWAAAVLVLARRLDPRPWTWLALSALFSIQAAIGDRGTAAYLNQFLPVLADAASWLPPPIFPAALVLFLAERGRFTERTCLVAAGITFGFVCLAIWGGTLSFILGAVLSAPAMVVGGMTGNRVHGILTKPSQKEVRGFVPLLGLGMPLLVGAIDLFLRMRTA